MGQGWVQRGVSRLKMGLPPKEVSQHSSLKERLLQHQHNLFLNPNEPRDRISFADLGPCLASLIHRFPLPLLNDALCKSKSLDGTVAV